MTPRTYTHPDVLTTGVADGWADPETDPTRIDWAARQAAATIPFEVVDGRPVNPFARTSVRYGRNELGHWGEKVAADAIVTLANPNGNRFILLVHRSDGHGWALPGGMIDPGETAAQAAVRELAEETCLVLPPDTKWRAWPPQYVPDPRCSDEAWIVTVPHSTDLGTLRWLPLVTGGDDADDAAWLIADSFADLAEHLARVGDQVFPAHTGLLQAALDDHRPHRTTEDA